MKILLDPGHCSLTKGKRSPDETLREYKWARELTSILENKLDKLNILHQRTTTPDEDDINISLRTRCKRANEIARKEKCILISIHCNAFGCDEKWHEANGWSIFVGLNASNNSKRLASLITTEAKKYDIRVRVPDPQHLYWKQDLAICRDTSMPAVLVENMFQDNKKDVEFLLSDSGKDMLSDIIIKGILNYL